jgi:D-alanyl-D-alanine carboxypeptidase
MEMTPMICTNLRRWPTRWLAGLLAASALLLAAGCNDDDGDSPLPAAQAEQIDAIVAKQLAAFGGATPIPGAMVAVWAPGQGTMVKAYGVADLATGRPMAASDKFRIGSNTKTFVVTTLLQLVDEGKVGLDDPLSKFDLGVTIPNATNITLRMLCNMTSGLFEVYHVAALDQLDLGPDAQVDPRTLIALAVAEPVYFPPGQGWYYSNTGYLIVGLVIEAVTGQPAGRVIEERLIKPWGLTKTTFPTTSAMPEPSAHGYTLGEGGAWVDETVLLPPGAIGTAGVMTSDVADMRVWVEAYVGGKTNKAATQAARLDCVETGITGVRFGLGIGCSGGWYGYTGGIPGYNTAAYHLPEEGATVIVFVTSQREQPHPGVANAILRDVTALLYPTHVAYPSAD